MKACFTASTTQVIVVRAPFRIFRELEAVEDTHDLECRETLRRRAQPEQLAAAIADAQRRLVARAAACQIVGGQRRADLLQSGRNARGELSFVEITPAICRQHLQRFREFRLDQRLADFRHPAGGHEDALDVGPVLQVLRFHVLPEALRRRDREALAGVFDRALEQRRPALLSGPGLAAEIERLVPDVDGRGRGQRRPRPPDRDRAAVVRQVECSLTCTGQRPHISLAVADHHEAVAAEAAEMRIGHAQRGTDGDDRLDRIAALAQHLEPCLRGKFVRARHHASLRSRQRARIVEGPERSRRRRGDRREHGPDQQLPARHAKIGHSTSLPVSSLRRCCAIAGCGHRDVQIPEGSPLAFGIPRLKEILTSVKPVE
ncbi:hypothetical protein ACVMIH_002995 [Bradyrhizobium sp. USDA 4503]